MIHTYWMYNLHSHELRLTEEECKQLNKILYKIEQGRTNEITPAERGFIYKLLQTLES